MLQKVGHIHIWSMLGFQFWPTVVWIYGDPDVLTCSNLYTLLWKSPCVVLHIDLERRFLSLGNDNLKPAQKFLPTEVICFPSVPWAGSGNSTDNLCGLQSSVAWSSIRETELPGFGAVVELFKCRLTECFMWPSLFYLNFF